MVDAFHLQKHTYNFPQCLSDLVLGAMAGNKAGVTTCDLYGVGLGSLLVLRASCKVAVVQTIRKH